MIYLAQTDTTAGFLSQNLAEINAIKSRPATQPCLICVAQFSALQNFARVPQIHKNLVRRSRKTTFIYPNSSAIRVVKDHAHAEFLNQIGWAYSSSANLHAESFDIEFAKSKADKIVDSELFEAAPSRIFRLSKTAKKRIR